MTFNKAACPVCRGSADFLVAKQDAAGQHYRYHRCRTCGFLFDEDFKSPDILQQKISKIYEHNYFEDIDYGWQVRGDKAARKINMFLNLYSFLHSKKPASVLDYGAGNGYITSKIGKGWNVFFYDKYIQPSYEGNYQVLAAPKPSDVVLAVEVVEHMTDMNQWAELFGLAGNLLIATTETSDGMSDQELADSWYLRPDVGHVAIYSTESLRRIAKQHGFGYAFFPSKSFHIFWRGAFLSKVNLVALEYPFYNVLRIIKRLWQNASPNTKA
jgi:hypothetical protein